MANHGSLNYRKYAELSSNIGGWGDEHNREIVLCRAVRGVRACARSGCLVEFGLK